MILDAELLFFEDEALSAATLTSDVLYTGAGEAGCPMTMVAKVKDASSGGTVSLELQTSASEDFSSSTVLGTFTAPCSVKVPRGNLGYMRLVATSTSTTGTLDAALVYDDVVK